MQKQKTLATSFSMQGKGLHTGLDIQITFHPAPENHGYKIKRVDLEGEPVIDAVAEKRSRNPERDRTFQKRYPGKYH